MGVKADNVKLRGSQDGVVSLLVTMVLMIVVSLIALGFAQVARNNQGQQLDQQLSTQAFYAAESGVNDAAQIISTELAQPDPPSLTKTSCASSGIYSSLNTDYQLTTTPGETVEYTCILVNPDPGTIKADISTTSKIIPVNASSAIGKITLSWSTEGTSTTPTNGCQATTAVKLLIASNYSNCDVGVLRVDLIPTDNAPDNAATMAKETMTFFAVPTKAGTAGTTAVTYNGANASTNNNTNIIPAECQNTAPDCTVTINTSGHDSYDMRVTSEYEDSSLQVAASNGTTNLPLSGAQVVIDATGRAQDVVRRIQVYVPIGVDSNQLSDYAIESTDSICKRYVVMAGNGSGNGYYASEMGTTGVTANNTALDPLCQ